MSNSQPSRIVHALARAHRVLVRGLLLALVVFPALVWLSAAPASGGAGAVLRAAARPGEIPLGEWSGEGVLFYDVEADAGSPVAEAARELVHDLTGMPTDEVPVQIGNGGSEHAGGPEERDKDGKPLRRTLQREYRTSLEIWPEETEGRDLIWIAIRSRRGPLPDLDNETRLLIALEPARRPERGAGLYRVVAFAYNAAAGARPELQDMTAATGCTCITRDDVTTLQIRYMDNYVDTFRFEGDRVEKSGVFGAKTGLIHWVEELEER